MKEKPSNKSKPKSLIFKIRNYFFAGIAISGPLILTILIIVWLVNLVDSLFTAVISLLPVEYVPKQLYIPGIGVIIVFIFLIIIGIIGTNFLGKYLMSFGGKLINKLPFIKFVYSTIKQIFDTLFSSKAEAFRLAVLFEYPLPGVWSIGFVTSTAEGQFRDNFKKNEKTDEIISIFIPTTPNPTSGFLVFVPKSKVIELNMTSNEAMKLIISGGMIVPDHEDKVINNNSLNS
ncbi:DUF502 domain-containing protein [Rickettsiales bacterium LUAb2]